MKCEWVKANGSLYLYDELPDDARYEVEQHLQRCASCAAEIDGLREFHTAMSDAELQMEEPTPNLLAASRLKLQEALETTEQNHGWPRWTLDIAGWLHQVRFSPALAGVLLMAGFAAGTLTAFRMAQPGSAGRGGNIDSASLAAPVASIRGITQDPNSNNLRITYDKLVPDSAQGSLDDPKIQQLLLYAAHSNVNSGVRLDSIDVLAQKPDDERIREALIFSLRYDKNPGVRLKALAGLRPYVKSDRRVRDVVLEALMRDSCPGVRTESIRALAPVTADTSVRETLQTLAVQDKNNFIRNESRRVLAALPEIE